MLPTTRQDNLRVHHVFAARLHLIPKVYQSEYLLFNARNAMSVRFLNTTVLVFARNVQKDISPIRPDQQFVTIVFLAPLRMKVLLLSVTFARRVHIKVDIKRQHVSNARLDMHPLTSQGRLHVQHVIEEGIASTNSVFQ